MRQKKIEKQLLLQLESTWYFTLQRNKRFSIEEKEEIFHQKVKEKSFWSVFVTSHGWTIDHLGKDYSSLLESYRVAKRK